MIFFLQAAFLISSRRLHLWRACLSALITACLGFSLRGIEGKETITGFQLNGSAALDALRAGLPRIAVTLYMDALAMASAGNANKAELNELRLGLTSALLASGDLNAAKLQLSTFSNTDKIGAAVRLRQAMIAFLERDHKKLETSVLGLNPELAIEEDKPWIAFLKAMTVSPGEKQDGMLSEALMMAGTSEQRAEFRLLRYRESILATGGSEVLAANLKRQMEEFRGRPAGREFAVQYAMVLHSLGKGEDALVGLRRQLELGGNEKGAWRDRLLLLYGLIAPPDDGGGRAALESLVEGGKSIEWMEMGLYLLVSRTNENGKLEAFLDRVLQAPRHSLAEAVISLRLKLALETKENDVAETCARRLMEEFPGSPRRPEALRALAAAAWRVNPPKYRLVADLLTRLRELEKDAEGRDKLSMQVADCHFLAGDYGSAAALYLDLRTSTKNSIIAERALAQAVNASLATGDVEKTIRWMDEISPSRTLGGVRWEMEWNLIARLQEMNRVPEAFERTQTLLAKAGSLPMDFRVRLMWLDASLALAMQEPKEALSKAEYALDFLAKSEGLTEKFRGQLKTQVLLTKGRTLLRAGRSEEGYAVLADLREASPASDAAAFTFLVEAYHHAAGNRLDEAQRSLLRLADGFKGSRYAPRALYEAALYLERRGLDENLKEGVDLLERLTKEYPDDDLVFYARIRQANLLRRQNEFGVALELCEALLGNKLFKKHVARVSASMLRVDCLLALARDDKEGLLEVAEAYAELKNFLGHPFNTRIEAAYKEGVVLRRMGETERAKVVYFRDVAQGFLPEVETQREVGITGKYWIARSLFDLGEILDREGETDRAANIYRLVLAHGLPGHKLALSRVSMELETDAVIMTPEK